MANANCLFCASVLLPNVSLDENEKPNQDPCTCSKGGHNNCKVPQHQGFNQVNQAPLEFRADGEDSIVHPQLKTFFVLRGILKLSDEVLSQLLSRDGGNSCPENWVKCCKGCGELVAKFNEDLKQISKLERSLYRIESDLKWKIYESRDVEGEDPVWRSIRGETIAEVASQYFIPLEEAETPEKEPFNFDAIGESESEDEEPADEEQEMGKNGGTPRNEGMLYFCLYSLFRRIEGEFDTFLP